MLPGTRRAHTKPRPEGHSVTSATGQARSSPTSPPKHSLGRDTPPSPPRSLHQLKCQGSQTSEPLSKSSSPVWSLRSSLFRATQQCHPPPLSENLSRETSPWQGHRSLSPTWEMAGSSQLQLLATFSDDLPGHSNAARKAKCTNPSLKCSFYFSFY